MELALDQVFSVLLTGREVSAGAPLLWASVSQLVKRWVGPQYTSESQDHLEGLIHQVLSGVLKQAFLPSGQGRSVRREPQEDKCWMRCPPQRGQTDFLGINRLCRSVGGAVGSQRI